MSTELSPQKYDLPSVVMDANEARAVIGVLKEMRRHAMTQLTRPSPEHRRNGVALRIATNYTESIIRSLESQLPKEN